MELFDYPHELVFSAKRGMGLTNEMQDARRMLGEVYSKAIKKGWAREAGRSAAVESAIRIAVIVSNTPAPVQGRLADALVADMADGMNLAPAVQLVMGVALLQAQKELAPQSEAALKAVEQWMSEVDMLGNVWRGLLPSGHARKKTLKTCLRLCPCPPDALSGDTLKWVAQWMRTDDLMRLLPCYDSREHQLAFLRLVVTLSPYVMADLSNPYRQELGLTELWHRIEDGGFLSTGAGLPAETDPHTEGAAAEQWRQTTDKLRQELEECRNALFESERRNKAWATSTHNLCDHLLQSEAEVERGKKRLKALEAEVRSLQEELQAKQQIIDEKKQVISALQEEWTKEREDYAQRKKDVSDYFRRCAADWPLTERERQDLMDCQELTLEKLAELVGSLLAKKNMGGMNIQELNQHFNGPTQLSGGDGRLYNNGYTPMRKDGEPPPAGRAVAGL